MSHRAAQKSLEAGTPPELICATCPWDRLCVMPPSMTKAEVDARIAEAQALANKRSPRGLDQQTMTLAATALYGGLHTVGQLCPVFILRLRGPGGRTVADAIRAAMQTVQDKD